MSKQIAVVHKRVKTDKDNWKRDVEPALYMMRLDVCRRLKLTAPEFANLIGYGQVTIRKWERDLERYYSEQGVDRILRLLSMFYSIPLEEFENASRLLLYYNTHVDEIVDHISKLKLRG